eukprot:2553503-Pleurochrysis_carterae.AAC.1
MIIGTYHRTRSHDLNRELASLCMAPPQPQQGRHPASGPGPAASSSEQPKEVETSPPLSPLPPENGKRPMPKVPIMNPNKIKAMAVRQGVQKP